MKRFQILIIRFNQKTRFLNIHQGNGIKLVI